MGEHVDECVDTEEVNFAFDQIADPGLGDTKEFGCLGLLESLGLDIFVEVDHQVGPEFKVFGFLGGETEVLEDISSRFGNMRFHVNPVFS